MQSMEKQIDGHDVAEEVGLNESDLVICYECSEEVELHAVGSHNCFIGAQDVYLSGRYVIKTATCYDTSQALAESDKHDNNTSAEDEDLLDDVDLSSKFILWNSKVIKCLLSLYPKYKNLFDRRKIVSKKIMYTRINKEMCTYGYTFTTAQIENKMKAFEKAYKKKLLNKGPKKSGRGRMCLEFEDELHDIFGKVHSMIPPVLIGTNCHVINNSKTNSEATDQLPIDKETSMKIIKHKTALTEDVPSFQLQDTCEINDISGKGSQEINNKENTFCENDKQEIPVKRKNEKTLKRISTKDIREKREKEKAARQHEYLKLKRIELKLKAKKYKAKYNIDIDNDVDDIDEM